MKTFFIILLSCLTAILLAFIYYYHRWKFLWELEEPRPIYTVLHHDDDTLRVVMIGDSWAGMHRQFDKHFKTMLINKVGYKVTFVSKGKGGEKTKGIYNLMYDRGEHGTHSILLNCPDYCIIISGINDAAANLGTRQYCYYYKLILELLLKNNIRPVIIEIPNVDIWTINKYKPLKDIVSDFMKSTMVGCGMYEVGEYRRALLQMLREENLNDQVLYIPLVSWNDRVPVLNKSLFLNDRIHLNSLGYRLLDSILVCSIVDDYNKR